MQTLSLITLVVACAGLLLLAVFVSVRFMSALFKRSSGYARLAATFPGDAHRVTRGTLSEASPGAPSRRLPRQTAQFGAVRYTRCVTIGILADGLFLQVESRILGRHRPILIPWDEIRATRAASIRVRPAVELTVGDPRVAGVRVLPNVYAEIRSRLAAVAPLVPGVGAGD